MKLLELLCTPLLCVKTRWRPTALYAQPHFETKQSKGVDAVETL